MVLPSGKNPPLREGVAGGTLAKQKVPLQIIDYRVVGFQKIIKFDTFIKYHSWKSENKRPCKIWNWTFYKCPKNV